uniref:Uncharacterized protein n=1 Tax=Panagrolaimus sp. ES5 TaxID=591445 RepID=A0AC34G3R4_9BILA
MDELLFLAASASHVDLKECTVTDGNGSIVQLEKIVANLPKLKMFSITFNQNVSNISTNTVKELIKLLPFSNISRFFMLQIPDSFDIETMYEYLKKTQKNFFLWLEFSSSISDAYFSRLEAIVDDIVETSSSFNYVHPFIRIPNLNANKHRALRVLFKEHRHLWKPQI